MEVKPASFSGANIAIEKERVLTAIEVVQRVLSRNCAEVGLPADDMFARGNENSTRTKHAVHFAACAVEITGMVQHGPRKYHFKCVVGKWQAFGKFLDHFDRQSGFGGKRADRRSPDNRARIRFERSDRKSFARERIACNAPSRAYIERPARAPAQQLRNRLPFAASK